MTEDGDAKQLPRLGLFSWENTLAADTRSDLTLVHGQEDGQTTEPALGLPRQEDQDG